MILGLNTMFDGIMLRYRNRTLCQRLLNDPTFEFRETVNRVTGEIMHNKTRYKSLEISIYPSGLIEIRGSLHKYKNNGLHNYDDFHYKDLCQVIHSLKMELGIDGRRTTVHNLEFGLNINTPFCPSAFLRALTSYRGKSFNHMDVKGVGDGREIKLCQYTVKIYNKGLQHHRSEFILRIEKKIVKMESLKYGPIFLSDLANKNLWMHCYRELEEMMGLIIISDNVDTKCLTKVQYKYYRLGDNPKTWRQIGSKKRNILKKQFDQIIHLFGHHNYRGIVSTLMDSKNHSLLGI